MNGDESHSAWKEQREREKRASKVKKSRRKYRALDQVKEGKTNPAPQMDNIKQDGSSNREATI